MAERPPKLPFAALAVMKWSRVLSAGEKWILHETYIFDRGPEGAWISNANLAERLGLEERTVKDYRSRLSHDGLLMTVPRPGARQMGWVFTLPPEATPHTVKPTDNQVGVLGLALDGHLRIMRGTGGRLTSSSTDDKDRTQSPTNIDRLVAPAAPGGIKGGPPTFSSLCETQLHPAVAVTHPKDLGAQAEDGVVAHATKPEDGGGPSVLRLFKAAVADQRAG